MLLPLENALPDLLLLENVLEPGNALESIPLPKPVLGTPAAGGVVGELGAMTIAPLGEPAAPAPGIDGAPDGVDVAPALPKPRPPPTPDVPVDGVLPLLRPLPAPELPGRLPLPFIPMPVPPLKPPFRCAVPKVFILELAVPVAFPEVPAAALGEVCAATGAITARLAAIVPVTNRQRLLLMCCVMDSPPVMNQPIRCGSRKSHAGPKFQENQR